MTSHIFSRSTATLFASLVFVLSACGDNSESANTSLIDRAGETTTTQPAETISFKGVTFEPPSGWSVVPASSISSCVPTTPNIVIVGDFSATGDCPPPYPIPPQILVLSELPDRTQPQQLASIGTLRGWVESTGTTDVDRSVIVLPQEGVDITFMGDAKREVDHVMSTVRHSS